MTTRTRLAALLVSCAAALSLTGATATAQTRAQAPAIGTVAAAAAARVEVGPRYTWATTETNRWGAGGPYWTYAVAVEAGLPYSADDFAAEVRAILTDHRSWVAHGDVELRQVSGDSASFVIRLTSPATSAKLCGDPFFNCAGVAGGIAVNADRWTLGDEIWPGDIRSYRALLINHEMGHILGLGHATCTDPGRLAPFMTPLRASVGCIHSAWPYSHDAFLIR